MESDEKSEKSRRSFGFLVLIFIGGLLAGAVITYSLVSFESVSTRRIGEMMSKENAKRIAKVKAGEHNNLPPENVKVDNIWLIEPHPFSNPRIAWRLKLTLVSGDAGPPGVPAHFDAWINIHPWTGEIVGGTYY